VSEAQSLAALAEQAARLAGGLLLERANEGVERGVASKTSPTDLVSEADVAAELAIRELLVRERPDDGFVGEEGDSTEAADGGLTWVVDPLDGTVNFLYGIPQWSVSVAVRDARGTIAGAVFDPNRDELFSATREGPPLLKSPSGEQELRGPGHHASAGWAGEATVSAGEDLAHAMVATGFAYEAEVREAQGPVLSRLLGEVRDIRRFGSAALDLVWTAAGRFDAYFERSMHEWDVAAGILVCERAGLAVLELPELENLPWGIVVARPGLAERLQQLVAGR
jgi:myo-inositol-1(or 4)-monophosphatase